MCCANVLICHNIFTSHLITAIILGGGGVHGSGKGIWREGRVLREKWVRESYRGVCLDRDAWKSMTDRIVYE